MSSNNINTLCRIDQAIRGLNDDGTDDSYVPAQSANGALERIEKSIKELDIKGIKSGLPKVTNADNGKVLQVKNGKWGKGNLPEGTAAVQISATDYFENYSEYAADEDNIYFVDGSDKIYKNAPIYSGPSVNITASSNSGNAWKAFNGKSRPSTGSMNECWRNDSVDDNPWICYEFDKAIVPVYFAVKYVTFHAFTVSGAKVKLQGSNNGTSWTDLAEENLVVDVEFGEETITYISEETANPVDYKYFRLFFEQKMNSTPANTLGINEIYISGYEVETSLTNMVYYKGVCYGLVNDSGSTESQTVTELTEDDYNRLTTSEKNNGTLYLVNGYEGDVHTIPVSSDAIEKYIENSSVCEDNVVGTSIESKYYGGVNIGNDFWFKTKIDLTNYNKFVYKLITGTAYSSANPSWYYTIGFMRAVPDNYWYGNSSDYVVSKSYNQTETIYDDEEIDVSKLTGEYYLCVCCHGWNAQLYDLGLTNASGKNSIKRNSVEYANDLGSNNSNVLLFQGNGSSNPEQIVLSDNYTEYDLLVFRTIRIADNMNYKLDKVFNVKGLETGDNLQDFGWNADSNYWAYQISNGTTLNRISNGNNFYLTNIYGIKL